jgi:type I restriction enzyme R subunit
MTSNFQFLKKEFAKICKNAIKAEQLVITDPRTSLIYSRMALEEAVNWMYLNDKDLELPYEKSLHSLLVQKEFKEQFNHKLYNELFIIKRGDDFEYHN